MYSLSSQNFAFLASVVVVLTAVIILILNIVCSRYTTKPLLIVFLLVSSCAAYFMDTYNIVIGETMVQNIIQTNSQEVLDLFSPKLLGYFLVLGVLPAVVVLLVRVEYGSLGHELLSRLKVIVICTLVIVVSIASLSRFYASFFRDHRLLRDFTNPTCYTYSLIRYLTKDHGNGAQSVQPLGRDAQIPIGDQTRDLIIFVVGEAVRADHLSLNGYRRKTNPLLEEEDVISFSQMSSCGTSTAVSVPCMFSSSSRKDYTDVKGRAVENVLDVVQHAGVSVLWRENNSDSNEIASRVQYENYRSAQVNPLCEDGECRDEGMLIGLKEYIEGRPTGDVLIVLHQMGSHGPAYYKRYPAQFKKFTPTCDTNQLEECSVESIANTYDNTIVYTDYFLSKVIALLKGYSDRFEATMIYIGDHGESLGEEGVYLHGMQYFVAPEAQKRVASIFWFGPGMHEARQVFLKKSEQKYSHDNVFHTLLGLLEIQTSVYNRQLDIFAGD